jgi:hypothetical protein
VVDLQTLYLEAHAAPSGVVDVGLQVGEVNEVLKQARGLAVHLQAVPEAGPVVDLVVERHVAVLRAHAVDSPVAEIVDEALFLSVLLVVLRVVPLGPGSPGVPPDDLVVGSVDYEEGVLVALQALQQTVAPN